MFSCIALLLAADFDVPRAVNHYFNKFVQDQEVSSEEEEKVVESSGDSRKPRTSPKGPHECPAEVQLPVIFQIRQKSNVLLSDAPLCPVSSTGNPSASFNGAAGRPGEHHAVVQTSSTQISQQSQAKRSGVHSDSAEAPLSSSASAAYFSWLMNLNSVQLSNRSLRQLVRFQKSRHILKVATSTARGRATPPETYARQMYQPMAENPAPVTNIQICLVLRCVFVLVGGRLWALELGDLTLIEEILIHKSVCGLPMGQIMFLYFNLISSGRAISVESQHPSRRGREDRILLPHCSTSAEWPAFSYALRSDNPKAAGCNPWSSNSASGSLPSSLL